MWAPDLISGLLPDIEHIAAFQALCRIGDRLLERQDDSFYVDYGDDFDLHCWTHKLYLLPITLATHSTRTPHRDLVDSVLEGWEEGEQIMKVADKLKISRYLAWKLLMTFQFKVSVALEVIRCLN